MMGGDRIVSIGGKTVDSWEDVRAEILTHPGEQLVIVVERGQTAVELTATPEERQDGTGFLGVQPGIEHKDLGVVDAFGYAGRTTGTMVALIIKGIGMMFSG